MARQRLLEQVGKHDAEVEDALGDVARGGGVPRELAGDQLDPVDRAVEVREGQQAVPGRQPALEVRVADDERPPGGQEARVVRREPDAVRVPAGGS